MTVAAEPARGTVTGAALGALAYVILGLSSLFWRALSAVPAPVLLGYRILASLGVLLCTVVILGRVEQLRAVVRSPRLLGLHITAALLVAINWVTFIWGSIHGRVLETGLGYLLAPVVTIGVGALVLRQRLARLHLAALGLCLAGLVLLIVGSGELRAWVYLTIGVTWGLYGFQKKLTPADPVSGLTVETATLAVVVVSAAALTPYHLAVQPPPSASELTLLAACGFVSVTPLWLLSFAAKRLSLTAAGFLQYVLPSTQFLVAVTWYGQSPSRNSVVCLAVVWVALTVLVGDSARRSLRAGRRRHDGVSKSHSE